MSDFLLTTKTHIPPLRSHLVHRPHLILRLNDGIAQNRRLTLISAPAGYGKSTLLSEWASQVGFPIAWLSLEKAENVPARFWSYLFTALSTIPQLHQTGIGEAISQVFQSPNPTPMEARLTNLVNDFAKLEERAILVLDDLHTITESQIHEDLVFLIEHLPRSDSGLHLVVASRKDPPWPLARWRVREELNELRPADLRFSYEEAVEFLNRVLPQALSSKDIVALQNRTEGWIAGLQMAAVTIQGRMKTQGPDGVSRYIETFTGSNRFILDYLMEEVISQQPVEIREFLHQTSILEQFAASLCDAIMDRHDSQAILEQVEQANLFVIPLDDERRWYRYHHLFAELLRKHLKQIKSDQLVELHRRASQWYFENGFMSEAVLHAMEAGDFQRVNKIISGNALAVVEHADLLGVLRCFESFTERQFASSPWLYIAYAWVIVYADPSRGLERILQLAEQSMSAIEDASERQRITGNISAIRCYYEFWVRGNGEKAVQFARQALESLPENDWLIRCQVLNTKGSIMQYSGFLSESIQTYEAAIVAGQMTGRPQETYFAKSNLANAHLLRGHLQKTYSILRQVLDSAAEANIPEISNLVLAHTYATMSLVQLEWNNVESAVWNARQGVALAETWKQIHSFHFALSCLSRALCAAGDLNEASEINHREMRLAMGEYSGFFRVSACDEIWLNLVKGDLSLAARRYKELESRVDNENRRGRFLVTKAALFFSLGQLSDVISELEEAVHYHSKRDGNWFLMNLLPFQALALHDLGRLEKALEVIGHCLAFAKAEGYVRIFLERGAPMIELLQVALNQGIETEYIQKLLNAFNSAATPEVSTVSKNQSQSSLLYHDLFEPLSEREHQVLRLLDSSLTSEEISRKLYVSVTTARTHIHNIYSKLGVHGRIEALQKAKELGLI